MLFETLLRLGDDSLILGQRLGEWCGHAPSVEVDLSLANIGLDLIGQATHFLDSPARPRGRAGTATRWPSIATCSISATACWSSSRTAISPRPWRGNSCSRPGRKCCSGISGLVRRGLAAIAAKAVKEVRYHAELAAEWVIRLGDGTAESRGG